MLNSIAGALMIATRQENIQNTQQSYLQSEALRHEERKRLELERQEAQARILARHPWLTL